MASKSKVTSGTKATSSARMESEFRKLGKNLDALIVKTRKAEAEARLKYASQLKTLKAKQAQAKKALARLGRRSVAAGGPLKAGVHKAWSDLNAAVRAASKRFRETP